MHSVRVPSVNVERRQEGVAGDVGVVSGGRTRARGRGIKWLNMNDKVFKITLKKNDKL